MLQKEDLWERLKTESVWVENTRTPLFAAVGEAQWRYVVGIWISGNKQVNTTLQIEKYEEDGTYTMKWSPIPVAPTDFRQIPKGSLSIIDPIVTCEGGTRLYGKTDVTGMSLNVTVEYWDWDV
jgi:hypothetical protein